MIIRVPARELRKALRLAQAVARTRKTRVGVQIRAIGQRQVAVTFADGQLVFQTVIASTNADPGQVEINVGHLTALVDHLPTEELTLRAGDTGALSLDGGGVQAIVAPERSDYDLPNQFELADIDRTVTYCTVEASVLREMLDRTLFACSNSDRFDRLHLDGVRLECDARSARIAATDGNMLAAVERDLSGLPSLDGVTIPRFGCVAFKRVFESAELIQLAVCRPYLYLRDRGRFLRIQLIEAEYPPYQLLLDKSTDKATTVTVCRESLLRALQRFSTALTYSDPLELIVVDDAVTLIYSRPAATPGTITRLADAVAADDCAGEPIKSLFRAESLVQIVSQIASERVQLAFDGDQGPCVIRAPMHSRFVGVVAPVRQ